MEIRELQRLIYEYGKGKGFHDNDPTADEIWEQGCDIIPRWLMNVVSELGEAHEAFRCDDRLNFAEELADAVLRILDDCETLGIDLEAEIIAKMEKNKQRPHMHGKKC